jgi:hypothetical protein
MAAVLLCAGLYTAATLCPLFGGMHATIYLSDASLLAAASKIRAHSSMPQQLRTPAAPRRRLRRRKFTMMRMRR